TDTNKLLAIRDPEEFCRTFIRFEDDIEDWLDILENHKGLYVVKPIENFDKAVQLLKDHQQDIEIIHNEALKDKVYHLKQILLQEEPTISIGQLPVLMSDIKEIIQQETEEQKNAVLIHANKLIEQLNELAEYYHQYDSIVKYIKEAAGDAVQLQGRIEESQRITSARINQQQL